MAEPGHNKASFLVVDDEQIVLSLVEDTLTDEGYSITTSISSTEAVEIAKNRQFDFLLTDIRMPGMNGIELARELRLLNPTIGVIFMTGYANLDTAKQAIKEGAYDYIMKPFELSEIRQALARAVEKKQSDASAALSQELNKIADLSNMMYTSGDLASLLKLSLSFAIIQSKADAGLATYIDRTNKELAIMSQNTNASTTDEIACLNVSDSDLDKIQSFTTPMLLSSIDMHPLHDTDTIDKHSDIFLPPNLYSPGSAVLVPLLRANTMLGFICLFHKDSDDKRAGADTQFLNFISSQLAISLENLQLLEESREAYRSLEALQEQSIQMEKMATRGQMSAEIGHELNNYLGVVVANFQLMDLRIKKGVLEGLEKYTTSITDHLDKISRFTKGLMDNSSLKEVKFEVLDINNLLSNIIEFLKPQKRFRDFDLKFTNETKTLEAEIDQGLIEQVLYNFLNNASDASIDSETKKIHIHTSMPDSDIIRISIRDYGAGIEQSKLNMLFKEKFTTKATGHGIGLVVCKNIMDKHNGLITVKSEIGKGAEFILDIPREHDSTAKTTRKKEMAAQD
ncbi:MAG: response regulator [candidate division Zixibacteria bacterium]|nr:response regulator [candidate division Zixibacteria bacterium]